MATNNIVDSLLISSTLEVSDTVTFSGTSDFIISSTGNVGIGTTSPTAALHVDIPGNTVAFRATRNSGTDGDLEISFGSALTAYNSKAGGHRWLESGSEKMRLTGGQLGIGTTSPGTKLEVLKGSETIRITGSATGNAFTGWMSFVDSAGTRHGYVGYGSTGDDNLIINSDGGSLRLRAGGTDVAYFTSTGVGIGTSSPSQKLDVNGVIAATGGNSTNWNTAYGWGDHAAAGYLTSYTETDTLATVVARGAYFGTTNQGYVQDGGTYGTQLRKIKRITLTKGSSNWDGDNHAILSKDISGTDADSISINSYNGIHLRLDTNNNNANSTTNFTIHNNGTGSGGELFRITGDGNVGIGTTSPSNPLHVYDAVTNKLAIFSSGDNGGLIQINDNDTTSYVGSEGNLTYIGQTASASANNLIINGSGDVGIGTTSPASTLDVNGAITFEGDTEHQIQKVTTSAVTSAVTDTTQVSGRQIDLYAYDDVWLRAGTGDDIGFVAGGSTQMFIDGSANSIGIGTTSPTSTLHLYGTNAKGWDRHLYLDYNGTDIAAIVTDADGLKFRNMTGGNNFYFRTSGNATSMYISDGGSVGIGTTSPAQKLHVDQGFIRVQSPDVGGVTPPYVQIGQLTNAYQAGISSYYHLQLRAGGSGNIYFTEDGNYLMMLSNAGNLGIGTTSPSVQLDIEDSGNVLIDLNTTTANANTTIRFQEAGANTATIGYDGTADGLVLANGGFTAGNGIFITSSNRVGVGTTSPSVDGLQTGDSSSGVNTAVRSYHSDGAYTEMRGYGIETNRTTAYFRPTTDKNLDLNIGNDGRTWDYVNIDANIFRVSTDGAETMRVNSSGRVGIGNTSPQSKLHVQDAITISNQNPLAYYNSGWTEPWQAMMTVGWGSTPGDYLMLRAPGNSTTNHGAVQIGDNLFKVGRTDTEYSQPTTDDLDSTWMMVNSTGMGIGNTSPDARLSINTASAQEGIKIRNVNSIDTFHLGHLSTQDSYLQMKNNAGTIEVLLRTDNGNSYINTGNIGIGTTSPSRQLHVSGSTFGAMLISGVANDAFTEYSDGTNVWKAGIDYSQSAYRITHTNFNGSGISIDSSGNLTADGDVTAYSDARLKENVETLPNALESVKAMRGVTYNKIGEEKQSIGVIAQEVQAVLPQLVSEHKDEMLSVAYGNITAVLIEAIKEQQEQIDELKAIINGLTK